MIVVDGSPSENCLQSWVKDTCAIYRVGMTRLGCTLIILGIFSISFGGTLFGLNHGAAWPGIGLWMGLPFCVAGGMCIVYRKTRPQDKISLCSVSCMMSALCASFNLATAAVSVYGAVNERERWFPKYSADADDTVLIVLNALLVGISLLALCISIWAVIATVGSECSCYNLGRHRVFTIPFGALEEEPPDVVPTASGPDIVHLDPFPRLADGAAVLQLCYIEDEEQEDDEQSERDFVKLNGARQDISIN